MKSKLEPEEYFLLKKKENELRILSINNAIRGFGRSFILDAQKIYKRLFGINVCSDCPYAIVEWLKQLYQEMLRYERDRQSVNTELLIVESPEEEMVDGSTFVAVTIENTESENTKKVIYNKAPEQPAKDNGKFTSYNRRNR